MLADELVDDTLDVGRAREQQRGLRAVAAGVDAGCVHRDEHAGVGVDGRDLVDAEAVEAQVLVDHHVEEVGGAARVGVELRGGLPVAPANVVQAHGGEHAVAWIEGGHVRSAPRSGKLASDFGVIDLHGELGGVADGAHDHVVPPGVRASHAWRVTVKVKVPAAVVSAQSRSKRSRSSTLTVPRRSSSRR